MIEAKIALSPAVVEAIPFLFAFLFGASIGSFLNVVIYRVPRDLSVNDPKRSFCPSCEKQLPMWLNIPLVSWVMLRAKCKFCGAPIAFRYFLVELVTALFFVVIWLFYPYWSIAIPFWVLISLLIGATFIDLEHYIIPDGITKGGTVAGLVLVTIVPAILREKNHFPSFADGKVDLGGFGMSALGALVGYGLLWVIVRLGKIAFGRTKHDFEKPAKWSITQEEGQDEPELTLGDEKTPWSEFFFRPTDKIVPKCPRVKIWGADGEKEWKDVTVNVFHDRLEIGEEKIPMERLKKVEGEATSVVIPREAMGYGDVKFMMMIGAFLGWQAVLFTILAGSVTGAIIGLTAKITGRQEWSSKIPFGPFLAFGAVVWMFYGPKLVMWYFVRMV